MQAKRKPIMIFMFIIMLLGQILGEIRAVGKLLIPGANGEKQYDTVITFTQAEIMIKCTKKIFQPFNEFDTPKQSKIKLNTAEVEEIQIQIQNNRIFIITKDSFTIRYRNVFNRASKVIGLEYLFPVTVEKWALIFVVDNPADIKAIGEELIKIIGKRCEVRS
ncbi:MAG: hypothetical protein JSV88_27480 [Candidatus Aminicenantes bacterium]|nr:MAG: hypothetical protein JSV88_27480 [Candidatus Aminicenantes bacterium]